MIAMVLGFIGGAMHVMAFLIYNRQMLRGESKPNTATWSTWVVLSTLNATSYFFMSGDWVKTLLPIASTTACIGTFAFSLLKGKLSKLDPLDTLALILGLGVSFVWWWQRNATFANLLLQIPITISFFPTYRGVVKNPKVEKALPWFIWSSAYIFSITTVILRWKGQPQDLVYPVLCLILHGGVGFLTLRKTSVII